MGLEAELRKEIRLTKLRRAILASLQVGSVLTVAAMAPKVSALLVQTLNRWHKESMRSALSRLKEKGLVHIGPEGVTLTQLGERYLDKVELRVVKPKRWDRKWRVVVFDIPEKRRVLRDYLRNAFVRIGFSKLQNSIWIYPYDCEELITLLKTDYRIRKEVLYMIVDKVENDGKLRRHFELS